MSDDLGDGCLRVLGVFFILLVGLVLSVVFVVTHIKGVAFIVLLLLFIFACMIAC